MKRISLVLILVVAAALAMWWYPHRSAETALQKAIGPAELIELVTADEYPNLVGGAIAFYHQHGEYKLAWVDKHWWGWEFYMFTNLSELYPKRHLGWSAWSPTGEWTFVSGTFTPEVRRITVQGHDAAMVFRPRAFWHLVDGVPKPPEVPVVAYNASGERIYAVYTNADIP